MKIKNNTILCVFALTALAATLGSCQSEDDVLNGLPQGSVPLVLGDVTVAGAQTVNNRAAGGNTRAAISENASGYTGIRKSRFVNGDVLNLTLSNGSGGSGENTSVTATLTGGKWVLTPAQVFITPGVTEVSAAHTATEQTTGIATDDLAAANADCSLTTATGTLAIAMKHAGAMIDITPGATDGAAITSITVNSDVPTAAEEEPATDGNGTTMHYRTLTADATVVSSISAVLDGTTYVATLATPITVAANKRYPVTLTFKSQTLTATPSAPQDWTDGGTAVPGGYTRIIDSPEALAQLAQDVNDGKVSYNTSILQTADIDLSQLKPAAAAGTNPLTGSAYTYTATADAWVSIGATGTFSCKYNGNGHTISNLKGSSGLFGNCWGSLTGIHLRNVSLTGVKGEVGALANALLGACNVTLCSATGSITTTTTAISGNSWIGGLIGSTSHQAGFPYITRCSADVDIDASGLTGSGTVGGFVGAKMAGYTVGCMATGDIKGGALTVGGFAGGDGEGGIYFCMATGNVEGSSAAAFMGRCNSPVSACYATGTVTDSDPNFVNTDNSSSYQDCAYTGTQTTSISGITGDVPVADLYAAITTGNASSTADITTLHWSAADGYTLTEVTRTWSATDIWKDNGTAAPTIDMTYEGWDGTYEGQAANLLAISGQTAYYVAPVNVDTGIEWGNIDFNTICPKGWHVPTKDEFVAMTGLSEHAADGTNNAAIVAAFPVNIYWASTKVNEDYAWCLYVKNNDTAEIINDNLPTPHQVRCVRKK